MEIIPPWWYTHQMLHFGPTIQFFYGGGGGGEKGGGYVFFHSTRYSKTFRGPRVCFCHRAGDLLSLKSDFYQRMVAICIVRLYIFLIFQINIFLSITYGIRKYK